MRLMRNDNRDGRGYHPKSSWMAGTFMDDENYSGSTLPISSSFETDRLKPS
jgi:hypothetical protein